MPSWQEYLELPVENFKPSNVVIPGLTRNPVMRNSLLTGSPVKLRITRPFKWMWHYVLPKS